MITKWGEKSYRLESLKKHSIIYHYLDLERSNYWESGWGEKEALALINSLGNFAWRVI